MAATLGLLLGKGGPLWYCQAWLLTRYMTASTGLALVMTATLMLVWVYDGHSRPYIGHMTVILG